MSLNTKISKLIEEKQKQFNIPGVAVLMVQNGKTTMSQGFGYANLEKELPIDMDNTLFRVASVSKTFTVTALLHLASQGKIDLEAEVNSYLEYFKVQNHFANPLKVKHLLCHVDGFEEKIVKANALSYDSIPPLKILFKKQLKPLFSEPGKQITYGNTGIALASYLIEKISGMPYETYVEKNIFRPLKMQQTIIHQNFTKEKEAKLATIYAYRGQKYIPMDTAYTVTSGTGGASVAPNEMAYFMNEILENDIYKQMIQQQFTIDPEMPGAGYGFFEHFSNNARAFLRDGSGFSINSRVVLWPELKTGLFIVANKASAQLLIDVTQCCFDEFYPVETDAKKDTLKTESSIKEFQGQYLPIQYSRYAISKLARIFTGPLNVNISDENELALAPAIFDPLTELCGTTHWQEIGDGLFEGKERAGRMLFRKAKNRIQLYTGIYYHSTYEKIKWFEAPKLHMTLFSVFTYVFLIASILSLITLFFQPKEICSIIICSIIALLNALSARYIIPFIIQKGFIKGFPSFAFIDAPVNKGLIALFTIPFITSILSIVFIAFCYYQNLMSVSIGIGIGIVIIHLIYIIFLRYWNLLRLNI